MDKDPMIPAVEASLRHYYNQWLEVGLNTAPLDQARAQQAICRVYALTSEAPPRFFAVRSPAAAWRVLAWLSGQDTEKQGPELYTTLGNELQRELRAQLMGHNTPLMREADVRRLVFQLGADTSKRLRFWGHLWDRLSAATLGQQHWCFGQHQASWMAHFQLPRELGKQYLPHDEEFLEAWAQVTRECGFWWPYRHVCIVSERPTFIQCDAHGRLHRENGAALQFADDFKLWCWRGVALPREAIEDPLSLTLNNIEDETRSEARRVLIERYGYGRFAAERGAQEVDADNWGTLYRIPGDDTLKLLRIVNGTPEFLCNSQEQWIWVPPTMATAREAALWARDNPEG